jgi:carbon storage regulator CsrA
MLVLTRREGEAFTADVDGELINIRILSFQGHHAVKIGITAKKDIEILRDELIERRNRLRMLELMKKKEDEG